jgi:hypothetical protein
MVNWLDLVDVARMDSAMCTQRRRTAFLSTAFGDTCVYDYFKYFSKDTSKRALLFSTRQFLNWVSKRGVRLSSLNIDQTNDGYSVDPTLATAIIRNTGLHLKAIVIGAYSQGLYAAIAECCPALENVHFNSLMMKCDHLLLVLRCCTHLRHITINIHCDNNVIAAIAQVGAHIEFLSVRFARGAGDNWPQLLSALPKLTDLDLDDAHISDANVVSIAQHCPQLLSLVLDENFLSDAAVLAVASRCTQLQRIGLPVKCHPEVITAVLTRCRSLTAVHFYLSAATAEVLNALTRDCPGLRELEIMYTFKGDVAALSEVIPSWPLLERLWLGNVKVSDILLQVVGRSCPCLRSFVVRTVLDSGISDTGIAALAKGCTQLRHLSFMSKQLTNRAIDAIVAHCRYIQLVEIYPNCRTIEMRPAYRKFLLI